MAIHAKSHPGALDHQNGRRLVVAWALAGCGAVVAVETASDLWSKAAHEAICGIVLVVALALLCLATMRRRTEIFFELLVVLAACAWIASGIAAHGTDGMVWAYSAVGALILISPSRHSEAFAAAFVVSSALALWITQYRGAALDDIAMLVLFAALVKLYKFSTTRHRKAVDAQRSRLELLLQCSDAGCFEWNGVDREAHYSPRLREMLGLAPDADTREIDLLGHLPPGFKNRVKAAFFAQMERTTAPYEVIQLKSMEYPLIRSDKTRIWVHARAIRTSDRHGKMAHYACTFVDITARLEVERHLRAANAGIEAKVREIVRKHEALEKTLFAREEVERISRHDLKTPLGQIASLADSLRSVRRPTATEEALLATLETTARRAMRMLRLAVDFYPMEDGQFEFTPEPVDMVEIVRKVCETFALQAQSKRIRFAVHAALGELWAQADIVLCETILENLLKNAIEAAPEDSVVTLRVSDGAKVRVSIHNQSVVPLAVRANFFEKYSTSGKPGGTGLGTYSARLMARAQFGELHMSTCESQGTSLILELMPVLDSYDTPETARARDSKAALVPLASLASRTFLIVDDDAYSALAIANMLKAHGSAAMAVNGRAAIESVSRHRPDVIFMDLEMPVMGGIEAIGMIRAHQRKVGQQPSTIVAMSASDDAQTQRRCRTAGFDRCLVKPVSAKCVLEVLGRVETCANTFPRHLVSSGFSMASSQG